MYDIVYVVAVASAMLAYVKLFVPTVAGVVSVMITELEYVAIF